MLKLRLHQASASLTGFASTGRSKLEVEHSQQEGRIVFPDKGTCLLHAEADKLLVSIEALEEEHLDQLEGVVENHLVRMAKDEELIVVWQN